MLSRDVFFAAILQTQKSKGGPLQDSKGSESPSETTRSNI
jgi:hypothetical protein